MARRVQNAAVLLLLTALNAAAQTSAAADKSSSPDKSAQSLCESHKNVANGGTTLVLDALTGRFTAGQGGTTAAPTRLPLDTVTVVVINQNPFLFTYALDVSSEPVGVAPIAAVVGALAQVAGLPSSIVAAAAPSATSAGAANDLDEWRLDSACPAAQQNQARQFISYLKGRQLGYEAAVSSLQSHDSRFPVEVEQPLQDADGFRKAMLAPASECTSVVTSARNLTGTKERLDQAGKFIAQGTAAVTKLAAMAAAIRTEVEFYESAFDRACMVPGVKRLPSLLTYDVAEPSSRYVTAAAAVTELKATIVTTAAVLNTPSQFRQVRVHHPGSEPARMTVRLRRLPNGDKGEGTLVAERRFEVGDIRRMAVSLGLFGGAVVGGKKLERFQPVLRENPAAAEPPAAGATAPPSTLTVVGLEREGRALTLPAGLIHFRPWSKRTYVTVGGGPSGESGAYALSYIVGASWIAGQRIVVTVGATSVVSQRLPPGLLDQPPSQLPADSSSIATTKERRLGVIAGVSVAIW